MPTKQGLFLKRLFYDKPAISVIFVVIMVIIAGYLIYSKEKNNDFAKTITKFQSNQVQTKEIADISDEVIYTKKVVRQKPGKAEPEENMKIEEVFSEEELIAQFEEKAVETTSATKVLVKIPRNILFSIATHDQTQVQKTMKDLADIYRETLNCSEPIIVHLMISGGVAGVHTFFPDKKN